MKEKIIDRIAILRGEYTSKSDHQPGTLFVGITEAKELLAYLKEITVEGQKVWRHVEDIDGGRIFGMLIIRTYEHSYLELIWGRL